MELVATLVTLHARQRVIRGRHDAVTNSALLDPSEVLLEISPPHLNGVEQAAVAGREDAGDGEAPFATALFLQLHGVGEGHDHGEQRVACGQLQAQTHDDLAASELGVHDGWGAGCSSTSMTRRAPLHRLVVGRDDEFVFIVLRWLRFHECGLALDDVEELVLDQQAAERRARQLTHHTAIGAIHVAEP